METRTWIPSELNGDRSLDPHGFAEPHLGEEHVPSMVGSLGQPRKPEARVLR